MRTAVFAITGLFFLMTACQEINAPSSENEDSEIITSIDSGSILINEISAMSELENEFGEAADWLELYNASDKRVELKFGSWSISDKLSNPDKYYLPEALIEPKGYLLIWCDKADTLTKDIHTNFKLSAKGETISLYYNGNLMDQYTYDSVRTEQMYWARVEDGDPRWKAVDFATPAKSNVNF
ncbi:MAG: lamin tail domain-containing protein [Crocinitomicaceae bacterium]